MTKPGDLVRQKLIAIVAKRGAAVGSDEALVRALLKDYCPQFPLEVNLLVTAVNEQVPERLALAPAAGVTLQASQLIAKLAAGRGLQDVLAHWAVESWGIALNVLKPGQVPSPARPAVENKEERFRDEVRAIFSRGQPTQQDNTRVIALHDKLALPNEVSKRIIHEERRRAGLKPPGPKTPAPAAPAVPPGQAAPVPHRPAASAQRVGPPPLPSAFIPPGRVGGATAGPPAPNRITPTPPFAGIVPTTAVGPASTPPANAAAGRAAAATTTNRPSGSAAASPQPATAGKPLVTTPASGITARNPPKPAGRFAFGLGGRRKAILTIVMLLLALSTIGFLVMYDDSQPPPDPGPRAGPTSAPASLASWKPDGAAAPTTAPAGISQ